MTTSNFLLRFASLSIAALLLIGCGGTPAEDGDMTDGDLGEAGGNMGDDTVEITTEETTTETDESTSEAPADDIVTIASGNDDFSTLVAAVQAAGLVETLQGEGPFTVFAPTNEAFAKLPEGTVEDLLKPESKDNLTAILTYHVVPGKVMAEQVLGMDGAEVATVQGASVTISVVDGSVKVDEATVTQTDIEASNGVIHVIDSVILPPTE